MSKKLFIGLLFVGLFVLVGGMVQASCNVTSDNIALTLTGDYSFCGSATLKNVSFTINANNIILDCNNSVVLAQVNGSGNFVTNNFKHNWTVKNCDIRFWDKGVNIANAGNNVSIYNNNFTVLHGDFGVYGDRDGDVKIYSNSFKGLYNATYVGTYNTAYSTNGTGIRISASTTPMSTNGLIENNTFNKLQYAINLDKNATNYKIRYNTITEIGYNGYAILLDKNNVFGNDISYNNITQGGWDAIVIRGNATVVGNIVNDWWHHGFDTLISDAGSTIINSGSIIENNTFIDSINDDPSFNSSNLCMLLTQIKDIRVYNNYCGNSGIRSYQAFANETATTQNHQIINNIVIGADEAGIYVTTNNSLIQGNIVYNVLMRTEAYEIHVGANYVNRSQKSVITLKDNIFPNGSMRMYLVYNGSSDINFYGNNNYTSIILPNEARINLSYNGNANFSITTNATSVTTPNFWTLSNQALQSPYDDIYNVSTSSVIAQDVDNYSITLSASQQIIVGDFSSVPVPTLTISSPVNGSDVFGLFNVSWNDTSSYVSGSFLNYLVLFNNSLLFNKSVNLSGVTSQYECPWSTCRYAYALVRSVSIDNEIVDSIGVTGIIGAKFNNKLLSYHIIYYADGTNTTGSATTFCTGGGTCYIYSSITPLSKPAIRIDMYGQYQGDSGYPSYWSMNYTLSKYPISVVEFDASSLGIPFGVYSLNVSAVNSSGLTVSDVVSVNVITDGLFNLYVRSYLNASINSTVVFDGSSYFGDGLFSFYVSSGNCYNLSINSSGFSSQSSEVCINSTGNTTLFSYLNLYNALNLSIYSYDSLSLITQNLSIAVTNGAATTYYTVSGNLLLSDLLPGLTEIKISNENFTESRYNILVVGDSFQSLNAYLLSVGSVENVTFVMYNTNGATVEGVLVGMYILSGSSYLGISSAYSDIAGKVYFSFNPSYSYMFNYSVSGYVSGSFVLNPPREDSYSITMQFVYSSISYSSAKVFGSASFNNVSESLTFSYSSGESDGNYSYTVSKLVNGGAVVLCDGSSNSSSGSFVCDLDGYEGLIFVQGVFNGKEVFFGGWVDLGKDSLKDFLSPDDASFIVGILFVVIVLGGLSFGLFGTIVSSVAAMAVLGWFNLLAPLNMGVVVVAIVGSLVVAFAVRR